jgi:hypothetical protein
MRKWRLLFPRATGDSGTRDHVDPGFGEQQLGRLPLGALVDVDHPAAHHPRQRHVDMGRQPNARKPRRLIGRLGAGGVRSAGVIGSSAHVSVSYEAP